MKVMLVGIGAAGNKAVFTAIEKKVVNVEDTIIINSTSKDFPKEYKGKTVVLSPQDTGCGKERKIAKEYALSAIKAGKLNVELSDYTTIIIITSVEGGTGSGASTVIAKFFQQVHRKNVHIVAFSGFEEDLRGLGNTLEFFQELEPSMIVENIRNSAFMKEAGENKFKAEELANIECANRIAMIQGKGMTNSSQNIDDTDISKVTNTAGYMTVEKMYIPTPLADKEDFNKICKSMIYTSKSTKSKNAKCLRIGIILNIDPASEDAIDSKYTELCKTYGKPVEIFTQKQWDQDKEYIAFIVSGMDLPIDEMKAMYNRYKAESEIVSKRGADNFFAEMKNLALDGNNKFDMIKPVQAGSSIDDFMSQFATK